MKKFKTILIALASIFALTGCDSVSADLDKDDVFIEMPEDYEYTKMVSYNEYSRFVTYGGIKDALSHFKMDMYTIASGIQTDTIAIATKDNKTGEPIAAGKTKISSYNPMMKVSGTVMQYVRGAKSYVDVDTSYTINYNGLKTMYNVDKYHMDLPDIEERGIGTVFFDDGSDPNSSGFVTPYTFLDALKEGGLIQDESTMIKVARNGSKTFYRIEFANPLQIDPGLVEYDFILVMNGRKFAGLYMHIKGTMYTTGRSESYYVGATIVPFDGKLSIPEQFTGYEKTLEQYISDFNNRMANLYK